MDDEHLNVLCDELRILAKQSPGVNMPSALRVRAIAQEIEQSVDAKGTRIQQHASDITDGFELWHSTRKWNQAGDGGRHVQSTLFASILKLEETMTLIHHSRVKPSARRWR